jgi:aerobic-type carbon monoxide dehydrogenase small subunit (CoxS/CutS family)
VREPIILDINGREHKITVDPERSLLEVLRDELHLTGSKYGCGEGQCGACTVLLGGKPVRSCVTAVGTAAAQPMRTIEGLADGERLHPVQQAFLDVNALQCGYCTPGMVMAAVALLERTPAPTNADVARALEGHLCRCGTYPRIAAAVAAAAHKEGVR